MAVTGRCPVCKTQQRIDNSTFKLARHKGSDGKRCPGGGGWPVSRGGPETRGRQTW